MEPLAIQSGVSQTVRPILALDANLTAVLREGRVVAGEILQSLDGKSILIGVGRHRVPAESQVELQTGDRFLARVEHREEGTVLRVLGGRRGSESLLLVALRNVVGEDKPVGELLRDLAGALRAVVDTTGDGDGRLARLIKSVGEHVYTPGADGEELQTQLSRAGFKYEARLLAAILRGSGFKSLSSLLPELVAGLLAEWQATSGVSSGPGGVGKLGGLLQELLEAFAGGARSSTEARSLGDLIRSLHRALAPAVESLPEGARRDAQLAALEPALKRLLGETVPTRLGARLLAALADAATSRALTGNLKAQLLAALESQPEGPAREAIARALAGIESEQLLNLARKEFQEGWHLSLPVPDGDRWATAHFFYRDPRDGDGEEDGDALQRLTMSVDFTALGPVRAEIGIRKDLVALRLVVTTDEGVERIRSGLDELAAHLEVGGRKARVTVSLGTPEEIEVDSNNQDIRWLREHHLMDLSG